MPDRCPPPEVMERLSDPKSVWEEINSGWKRLDESTKTFHNPTLLPERGEQLGLIPKSFAHLKMSPSKPDQFAEEISYHVYDNVLYPHEQTLMESLVKAAVDDQGLDDPDNLNITSWGELLRTWISMMVGYLNIGNDIMDTCDDNNAIPWYSNNFGRSREQENGAFDRRVTKRLGSGKEMSHDMAGNPIP